MVTSLPPLATEVIAPVLSWNWIRSAPMLSRDSWPAIAQAAASDAQLPWKRAGTFVLSSGDGGLGGVSVGGGVAGSLACGGGVLVSSAGVRSALQPDAAAMANASSRYSVRSFMRGSSWGAVPTGGVMT